MCLNEWITFNHHGYSIIRLRNLCLWYVIFNMYCQAMGSQTAENIHISIIPTLEKGWLLKPVSNQAGY